MIDEKRTDIMNRRHLLLLGLAAALGFGAPADAQDKFITVASTTSTEQSGLFGFMSPKFKEITGIEVRVVALGTGQALDVGRRGDADVVFVHDKAAEEKFVAEGHGVERLEVMYNDFVIVGPKKDPAKIAGSRDVVAGLKKIHAAQAPFVSRGDRSGTHAAELRLWQMADLDMPAAKGAWYRETGSGMGPSLNTASALDGYILTDRATWLNFKNRGDLAIVVEGDTRLFNQYGIMLVNPVRHPHVKQEFAKMFIAWVIGAEGQRTIGEYKIGGEPLFFANARKSGT